MLVYDTIKIRYVREGYLPNWPYHLTSDEEMCDAFMRFEVNPDTDEEIGKGFFFDYFPLLGPSLKESYNVLVAAIRVHIELLKTSNQYQYRLPDWVCSYMLGQPIGPNSTTNDIHDLICGLGVDNLDDLYEEEQALACLRESTRWLKRHRPASDLATRPPTMFGEPHVSKSIRVKNAHFNGGQ